MDLAVSHSAQSLVVTSLILLSLLQLLPFGPPKPSGANGISELVIHPEYNTQVLSKHKATVKQLGLDGRCGLGAWHPMLWEDYARNADG